jgi:MFS family permease
MNMGVGLGGVVGGFLAVNGRAETYDRLFLIDVASFVIFGAVVATIRVPRAPATKANETPPSFRSVLAVPFFRRLLVVDLATAITFSLAFELLPIHAAGRLGITNHVIGVFFMLNTFAVAFAQLPMVRLLEGRLRMRAYELMHLVYAAGLLAILITPWVRHGVRLVLLGAVMLALGLGETVYGAVRPAMVTELFPPAVLGRAFAVSTGVFNLGMSGARAGGGALLDRSRSAPWLVGGVVCLAAAFASRRMARSIPSGSERNPMPVPARLDPA